MGCRITNPFPTSYSSVVERLLYKRRAVGAEPTRRTMKVKKLTVDELFDLTTGIIGHCNNVDQLKYIIKFTEARIRELERQALKK